MSGKIAPQTATPTACIHLALRLAGIRSTDTLLDVGCNDARVLITAASSTMLASRPKRCIGVEIVEAAARSASERVHDAGLSSRVEVISGDVTLMPRVFRDASVVFLFMALTKRTQLMRMIARECRPGTRIVTYLFPLHATTKEDNDSNTKKEKKKRSDDDDDDVNDSVNDVFNDWFVRSESVKSTRPNGIDVSQFSTVYLYRVLGPKPPRAAEAILPLPSSVPAEEFSRVAVQMCTRLRVDGFCIDGDRTTSGGAAHASSHPGSRLIENERILGGITNELVRLRVRDDGTNGTGHSNGSDNDDHSAGNGSDHTNGTSHEIRDARADVVVRVFGPSSELFINRVREREVVEQMSRRGSGARVLGTFANGRIETFITGTRVLSRDDVFGPGGSSATLHAMAQCVRTFHESDVLVTTNSGAGAGEAEVQAEAGAGDSLDKSPQLWRTIRGFRDVVLQFSKEPEVVRLADEVPLLQSICDASLQRHFAPVFAHNDLLMGNFLLEVDAEGKPASSMPVIHLIDFEYSCYGELCYDLANMFNEFAGFECHWDHVPSDADMRRFLMQYFSGGDGDANTDHETAVSEEDVQKSIVEDVDAAMREIQVYRLVRCAPPPPLKI